MTTLQTVELGVLGPLQVRQYGLPVAIPGAKPRAILTMLGLHGGSVVSAGTFLELLWGDDPPRTAAKALQTHISSLRRTLGDGFVLTAGTGWTLTTTEVDATRYKLAAKEGREALAAGDISQAVARFDDALTLWRGTPELPDGARGTSEKTRWAEGHAALVEDRADSLLATGRAAEIIGELEAAIADAPLRERRWGQLMLALYRAGRQGEALGAYQRARSLLADELGVDPGPDLRRLEAAIVAQDAALETPVSQQVSVVTRAVTFLLTDIEGSTAAWEADADAMAAALARHDEIVEQVVTSRGGRLIKTRGEGDATFSVFDRPSAAASAAIDLQEAIRHEPWALLEPMRIRVALHIGEVELRDGDYFGRAVNRAARLRSLATGDQILCSGATAELVIDSLADDVLLVDLGMRQLKNLARPEHVFELRLETATDSPAPATDAPIQRPGLPAVLAGPGPFVGRGPELAGLLSAWQTTLDSGTRAVLIAGEPGVGKTRLAGEWSRQAYEDGAVVLYGRCDEDLGAPYQPFAEALRSLVPCLDAGRLRKLRGVEALLPLVPGLTDVLPDLAAPTRADPDTERYALFDAVVAVLGVASASAPVVVILDDLHWAEKPTLLLLRHLLRFGEHARVQIVGTYRSTDLDRSHPLAAMLADLHRDGSASRLTLSGLDEDDVTAYVAEAGYDDEELARALATVTGGNPFFLIEALRHVDESGGRWDPTTLPQGVREAVSRRLSRLPAETNKALAAAAVVGSRFALELVERVVDDDLVDAFDEACKAGIVIEEHGGRYRFNHAIVRQSLLAELASVRRMRLHQRIAATLETEPGAEDELLAELAYHYFECAWGGNAAKAVDYCQRAADQAMARLGYEGAADLYDKALHALDEIDEELPDRDDQQAELLVARCEALLAAGDVVSATGAVSQLQGAAGDSARLAAWGTCFDGQLSMLTDPDRLDEIESAVAEAAEKLAGLDDAAGEAKAHTVRAGCLARLGRIGDCETALDQALTAARRAHEHRRVNAVLANAPLAALWGPNPVPRAGGRCLDVVRLLRITTGSPVVEATSTRCQGVLDAFRGRAAAGRQLIDSARRSLTELGMRHALLEVDQFAGIVELVADDAAAAEAHLRRAYHGFRRMGLDADTAETAALLARAYIALDRDAAADELCTESEHLAGHALKPSIAWRTVRAQLLARNGAHDEARRVAEEAVTIAERTDALVDHGDACLALATVLRIAGDIAGAQASAERAVGLYELKGAAALAEKARSLLGAEIQTAPAPTEVSIVEPENACVRAFNLLVAAFGREAWGDVEKMYSPDVLVESRRKIVGWNRIDLPSRDWPRESRRLAEMGPVLLRKIVVAVRGERLALTRLEFGTDDKSPGAPQDPVLQLNCLDEQGRFALQMWFDVDDLDAAIAELDAAHARLEQRSAPARRLDNAANQVLERYFAHFAAREWDAMAETLADDFMADDRRRVVNAGVRHGRAAEIANMQAFAEVGTLNITLTLMATRGERLVLVRDHLSVRDWSDSAYNGVSVMEINADNQISAHVLFDPDDLDAAFEELDARYTAGEAAAHAHTWSVVARTYAEFNRHDHDPPSVVNIDNRRVVRYAPGDLTTANTKGLTPNLRSYVEAVHRLGDLGVVVTTKSYGTSPEGFDAEWRVVLLQTVDGDLMNRSEMFDEADIDAALARFDELSHPAQRLNNAANQALVNYLSHFPTRDWDAMAHMLADDFSADDRRHVVNSGVRHGRDAEIANVKAIAEVGCTEMTSTPIAIRGERLVLSSHSFTARDWPGLDIETIDVVEINADNQIVAEIAFDADDLDAAFEELDSRYLAGEAAPHADTWSVIARAFVAHNRRELAATTPDWVSIDHRRGTAFAPGDILASIRAIWDLAPDLRINIEAVHRLSNLGAVVTHAAYGTSQEGFPAEWRAIDLLTIEGELINRGEIFDEADLDAALAKFDQLSRPARQLENTASQVDDRFWAAFAARDWVAIAETLAGDVSTDDRRHVVNAGVQHGRDAVVAEAQSIAAFVEDVELEVMAIRGGRLVLRRCAFPVRDEKPESFFAEVLCIVEVDADNRIVARIVFDLDDIDAAFEELDARYLAGEAAAHAHTWSVITGGFATLNRHELPPTTPDSVSIDHRRGTAFGPGELIEYVRAGWELDQDIRIHVEVVHRLTDLGAVCTHVAHGTSRDGFAAEWRGVDILTVEGDIVTGVEVFDEADLDAALVRFDELSRPAAQLENAASRMYERFNAHLAARDWDAMAEMLADDVCDDDRRRVVSGGIRRGRDAQIANLRAVVDVGVRNIELVVIATRGERLALCRARVSGGDQRAEAFALEMLSIVEIGSDGLISAGISFDVDDIDAAFEELDAQYLAGEAAVHAHTWSVIAGGHAAFNRHEVPAITPDWVNIDHRRAIAFTRGELIPYIRATWDLAPDIRIYIEAVHGLSDLGAVVTQVTKGTSQEGFDAEWQETTVVTVEGDLINRVEIFDQSDIDTALARFDELSRPAPRLENAASQADERFVACFAAREWTAMAETLAEDTSTDDRRRVVGAGIVHGRDNDIAAMRASADIGVTNIAPTGIATRGERLALSRARASGRDQRPEAFHTDALGVVEIDSDNQIVARVIFDVDDIDAAFAELESRYLAGEAATHAHTWSVVAEAFAAVNRHELPELTPNWANIDHRRASAFTPGDMAAYTQATFEQLPDVTVYIEAVHRLSDLGAVVAQVAHGTSQQGFEAEWREIGVLTVEGDLLGRYELYDEADLDAALAKFDELSAQSPRLGNAASQVDDRFWTYFAARDWTAMTEILAEDMCNDDRRRVVGAGVLRGRDTDIAHMRAIADVGAKTMASTFIATRGEHLALRRLLFSGEDQGPEAFQAEVLFIVEIDADERVAARVSFDADDIDAAFAELDARYLAGEAAPYARVWQFVMNGLGALNRHEPGPMTREVAYADHRRLPFAPGDFGRAVEDLWALVPDARYRVTAVHALDTHAVVGSLVIEGTDPHGNELQWARSCLISFASGQTRMDVYEEDDLDAALTRFEELRPAEPRLENAASQLFERFEAYFAARDWTAMAEILADDMCNDDRRRVVGAGVMRGRDTDIAHMRAIADVGAKTITSTFIATRGERLVLRRVLFSGGEQQPEAFQAELLGIVEVDDDQRIEARISFDLDDVDAAFEELDARYLAGEAAAQGHTWSLVTQAYTALNRRELPATTPDWVNIDHRHGTSFAPGEMPALLGAVWNLAPDLSNYVESVHRLNNFGAVVTNASHEISREGFYAEWRVISVVTFEGDWMNRCEVFDEADLDTALARFDELSQSAPRLVNAAGQVYERFWASFRARDWSAMTELLASAVVTDDRRRVVNAGIRQGREVFIADMQAVGDVGTADNTTSTAIMTRGDRLTLNRIRSLALQTELLNLVEIDADEQIVTVVVFDVDYVENAVDELDARYLAGEGAANADTWSVIARMRAAFNRHELRAVDWANIDHRRGTPFASSNLNASISAVWDLTPDLNVHIEAVHRLTSFGAVVTDMASGTSPEGFDAEWRNIELLTVEGGRINRCEIFDEADLDAALARFDELQTHTTRVENAASRAVERYVAHFARREWDGLAGTLADDIVLDDRRPIVGAGLRHGRHAEVAALQAGADAGFTNIAADVVATRGERLVLTRSRVSGRDRGSEAFHIAMLGVCEIDADERIVARVMFDVDDIDAAFEELDGRYLAGEAAVHAQTWSLVARNYAAFNRHEFPAAMPDWVSIDHRRGTSFELNDLAAYIRSTWDVAPDTTVRIEAVHRISNLGAVITQASTGTSQHGFEAAWREICLLTYDGELTSGCELFDEADLDAALARFDELTRPARRLETAASQVVVRLWNYYASREWNAMAELLADGISTDDRRRVVNAGVQQGRDVEISNMRASAEIGANVTATVVATRGEHLVLTRVCSAHSDLLHGEFDAEMLNIIETDADNRIVAGLLFDLDDIDAAFEEFDARYLAGEAAAHSHTWSVITRSLAGINRRELFATTPDWINIDHRRVTSFAPGDLFAFLRASWDQIPDITFRIETVHRLSDLGTVVTQVVRGTSQEGFEAEWRYINVVTVEGALINGSELFDEADIDTALARFDELNRAVPKLENTATRIWVRLADAFNRRDVDKFLALSTADGRFEDRRKGLRVVLEGPGRRKAVHAVFEEAPSSWLMEVVPVAVRGSRLSLTRECYRDTDDADRPIAVALLNVTEVGAGNLMQDIVAFDPDDIDAAFEELDARYLAGEAADHAHTWSVIAKGYAALNRRELPATTPDWVNIDHRHGSGFEPGGYFAFVRAAWEVAPDMRRTIEAVHRLNTLGVVFTHTAYGTSREGFDAEWRTSVLLTVDGDLINRLELFEEADLDAALARFDELNQRTYRLDNAATRSWRQIVDACNRRDADGFLALTSADGVLEDRRKGLRVSLEGSERRKAAQSLCRAPESWRMEVEPIAVRGYRLGLTRERWRDTDQADRPITVETLTLTEVAGDELVHHTEVFDPDDIDEAFAALDARYIAGEAGIHSRTWSVITQAYASFNRHDQFATDWLFFDHRRGTPFASNVLVASAHAALDLTPDLRTYVETMHRLRNHGAVVTHTARGTSPEGFDAEWRMIQVLTVEGNRINRCEIFDEDDLDAALARFEELSTQAPVLGNAATRARAGLADAFNRRDSDGFVALIIADDGYEDRRKGLRDEGPMRGKRVRALFEAPKGYRTEMEPVAIRGPSLALTRDRYRDTGDSDRIITAEHLTLTETDDSELVCYTVLFDPDDVDGALAELTARWIASGEVAHPEVIESARRFIEAGNRHDWDTIATREAGATFVNHRQLASGDSETITDHWSSLRMMASLIPDMWLEPAEILTHSASGLVIHLVLKGTSTEGFALELPVLAIILLDGDRVTRLENFDSDQRDAALGRFEELNKPT